MNGMLGERDEGSVSGEPPMDASGESQQDVPTPGGNLQPRDGAEHDDTPAGTPAAELLDKTQDLIAEGLSKRNV